MLTFLQERQQNRILENNMALREERDPKRITYLKDKRILLKSSRRRI